MRGVNVAGTFRVAGLFAGIGGIELGFQRAFGDRLDTVLLCESWTPAKQVLAQRFDGVDLHSDVKTLRGLPGRLDVLAAGFPCTDLSQAGRTAGIQGKQSGLVSHLFDILRIARSKRRKLPWLVIENVPNMLALDRGQAMAYLVRELGDLGYRWAYRVVDSRFTGLPQRRRRVVLVASCINDPRSVLFSDEADALNEEKLADNSYGFYWTEGRTGVGWARDAVPTLKGGSGLGIPSPPAIWLPNNDNGETFVLPTIEDGEILQGFSRGWTSAASDGKRDGHRWKLIGNAVTVGVSEWVAGRLKTPGSFEGHSTLWTRQGAWPTAAWGEGAQAWKVELSEFPQQLPYRHLLDLVDVARCTPLSSRAANGFWSRLRSSNLGRHPGFREDLEKYVERAQTTPAAALAGSSV